MLPIDNGGIQLDKHTCPRSGVRQGCPLSPSLIAVLIWRLAISLEDVSPCVIVLLYADDLLIIITRPACLVGP